MADRAFGAGVFRFRHAVLFFPADLAQEFRRDADIGRNEFLWDVIPQVWVCLQEDMVSLLGRKAHVLHQAGAGAYERVLGQYSEVSFQFWNPSHTGQVPSRAIDTGLFLCLSVR